MILPEKISSLSYPFDLVLSLLNIHVINNILGILLKINGIMASYGWKPDRQAGMYRKGKDRTRLGIKNSRLIDSKTED
ncbi:hypothetical protein [Candidatus Liberibacter sp.]|uniref:hypothetical protein n=1 Tax=Candidatus Liberibacter sp. TaxID=34022 RepID=UPI0015F4CE7D|nr:hypothetical protein [Candidatus Liberibacter sp.]